MLLPMILPGIIASIFGVLFLCAPHLVKSKRSSAKHWIETDTFFLQHRIGAGLCLIVIGVFCLSSAFYVWLRLHP